MSHRTGSGLCQDAGCSVSVQWPFGDSAGTFKGGISVVTGSHFTGLSVKVLAQLRVVSQ